MHSTPPPRPRKLRPRAPIAPEPVAVSQLTCLAIVGIDDRRFLELLNAHPEVPRAVVGKLRVVQLVDLRALLARLAAGPDAQDGGAHGAGDGVDHPGDTSPEHDVHDDGERQPETAGAVLAALDAALGRRSA